MESDDLCLVTGVSGYLGSWLAKMLLEQGFRVRGTVRSLNDVDKVAAVEQILPGIHLAAADLRSPEGWLEAVAGVKWVFHVASPQAVATETDRTGGAVRGTEYLMRAALAEPSVAKIVLTSSEAAIAYGFPRAKQRFTEEDWTVLEGAAGKNDYFRSKTLAERLAWDLVRDPAVNRRGVQMAVINPSFIAGPSLVPWGRFSLETLASMATGKIPALPDMVNHVVDVRDCAAMHIALMQDQAANGHRHFSFAITGKMTDMTDAIRKHYARDGFKPKPFVVPTWILRLAGLFSNQVGSMVSKLGAPNVYAPERSDAYHYRYTNIEEVMTASMDSMLRHGWLAPKITS
jgi:nucleoside-diphosphate-sugar epimerase